MRHSTQTKPWLAALCWRLLIALQLPKDAVVLYKSLTEKASPDLRVSTLMAGTIGGRTLGDLRNTSEVQASERIIPDITDLDPPVAMGNRMREPIVKAIQEVARISWDQKRKGSVEDEDDLLPSEELKCL